MSLFFFLIQSLKGSNLYNIDESWKHYAKWNKDSHEKTNILYYMMY